MSMPQNTETTRIWGPIIISGKKGRRVMKKGGGVLQDFHKKGAMIFLKYRILKIVHHYSLTIETRKAQKQMLEYNKIKVYKIIREQDGRTKPTLHCTSKLFS